MYAEIKGALDSVKVMSDILEASKDLKNFNAIASALSKVNAQLMSATAVALASQEKQTTLASRVSELENQLREFENWEARFGAYELTKTAGGAVVYEFKGEPKHFACPSCVEKRQIQILQDNRTMTGKFRCTACAAEFPINPHQGHTPVVRRSHDF